MHEIHSRMDDLSLIKRALELDRKAFAVAEERRELQYQLLERMLDNMQQLLHRFERQTTGKDGTA